jgi:(1->4)-alpha-D-glucan 1-alpha-D-glucosylmutase
LSQTLLKATTPGVPDFYQGTELWDLSLVDPDNRRPVNFEQRLSFLKDIKEKAQEDVLKLIQELLANKEDGRIKLFLTARILEARKQNLQLFQAGDYIPLEVVGKFKDQVVAFAKQYENKVAIALAPRMLTSLVPSGTYPLGKDVWQDTQLQLPVGMASSWKDVLTDQLLTTNGTVLVGVALKDFPVALLISQTL